MIEIEIPGVGVRRFQHLVLDVNGTLAKDGVLTEGVVDLLSTLREKVEIHIVTADTHGTRATIEKQLGLPLVCIPANDQAQAKLDYISRLNSEMVVAVGNGANDALMLENAALGILVIGPEGAALSALNGATVVVTQINTALELLLYPKRLSATLRR